jgi:hypothetical protein
LNDSCVSRTGQHFRPDCESLSDHSFHMELNCALLLIALLLVDAAVCSSEYSSYCCVSLSSSSCVRLCYAVDQNNAVANKLSTCLDSPSILDVFLIHGTPRNAAEFVCQEQWQGMPRSMAKQQRQQHGASLYSFAKTNAAELLMVHPRSAPMPFPDEDPAACGHTSMHAYTFLLLTLALCPPLSSASLHLAPRTVCSPAAPVTPPPHTHTPTAGTLIASQPTIPAPASPLAAATSRPPAATAPRSAPPRPRPRPPHPASRPLPPPPPPHPCPLRRRCTA